MSTISVHPIESGDEHDTKQNYLHLRIKILEIVTGKPLPMAYATKPQFDAGLLDRLSRHPLRVLKERETTFTNNDTGDFKVKDKNLRTFVPEPPGASLPSQLKASWQLAPEFILTRPGRIADNSNNVFQKIDDNDARYVCIKSGSNNFCERALVTNKKGILEIPVTKSDWTTGAKVTVQLRDYKILQAEDNFEPENHKQFKVTLDGNPTDNKWSVKMDESKQEFADFLDLDVSTWYGMFTRLSDSFRSEVEFSLWAVRKAVECSSSVRTQGNNRPAGTTVRGVVIHYNSGYYISEKRGSGKVLCRNVFDDSEQSCLRDNNYFSQPELCMQLLKKIYTSGRTGYHYHVDRTGEIVWVVDEDKRCYHSGKSREPNTVTAQVPNASGGGTANQSHTRTSASNKLDNMYIGINLTGYHTPSKFHFTERQIWYLDRLLENIRNRRSDVVWHNIIGHDEARAAYKTQFPSSSAKDKSDPGAALADGMVRLRGRHYT